MGFATKKGDVLCARITIQITKRAIFTVPVKSSIREMHTVWTAATGEGARIMKRAVLIIN
jgi:hypothetical protein